MVMSNKRQKNVEGENAEASKQATKYDDFDARIQKFREELRDNKTIKRELRANAAIQRMRRQRPVDAEQKHDKERQKTPTEAEQKRVKERLKREKAALQRRERKRVEKLIREVTKMLEKMSLSKYDSTPLRF